MATVTITLSKKAQCNVINFYKNIIGTAVLRTPLRERMEVIDRKYYMELSKEALKKNVKGKLDPTVTPTVLSHVETAVAQLCETFLSGYPIFAPITSPDKQEHMDALTACFAKQEKEQDWRSNIVNIFRDAVKYNRFFSEVEWVTKKINGLNSEGDAVVVDQTEIVGNTIRRLDPYNCFYDETVTPDEVHKFGQYAGYVERMSKTKLLMLMENWEEGENTVINKEEALCTNATGVAYYYTPDILNSLTKSLADEQWEGYFGFSDELNEEETKKTLFEVTTLYVRAAPKDLKLNIPASDKIQIFKFVIVNGQYLVAIRVLNNLHGYLPMLVGAVQEPKLKSQAKAIAEMLIPIQDLSTDFHTARLATIKRSVGDRLVYNSRYIRARDINSPNPASKIAVKNADYNVPMSNIIHPIPFRDDSAQYIISEANVIGAYGNMITGQNPTAQGQHTPGNKTVTEFQTMMSNSSSRTVIMSIVLESIFFAPLKSIILYNTIQYQEQENYYDTNTQEEVQYNPIEIRRINWDFDIADGNLPMSKIANTQAWVEMMQYVTQIPTLAQTMNIAPMFSYVFKLLGVRGMDKFQKTQQQLQEEYLQQLALAQAQNPNQQGDENAV